MSEEVKGNSAGSDPEDSRAFFEQLESSVNGMVTDGEATTETETTQSESGSNMVTRNESQGSNLDWDNENNPYKKRYADSSREAVKMNQQLNELKPFVPVLTAMKKDSGLVDHVREYLQNGGKPDTSIKQQLNLPEDFEYDANEAVEDPDSNSAKLMNAQIDKVVNQKVGKVLEKEKMNAESMQKKLIQRRQEIDFIKKHNLSKEDFLDFKRQAQSKRLSLDDIYYVLNKDKSNTNVANSTKQDMLNQMKNVRDIPTSTSDSNNQGTAQKSKSDDLFDAVLSVDGGLDELFG